MISFINNRAPLGWQLTVCNGTDNKQRNQSENGIRDKTLEDLNANSSYKQLSISLGRRHSAGFSLEANDLLTTVTLLRL